MPPKKTIEQTYQKKSQLEHVLHRPGMYIGDIERITTERWVLSDKITRKQLTFSPGLYKIFDENFTNATDHSQLDLTMKKIEVTIADGEISIFNDSAIPVEIHKELGKYVPEIIFGEFHTSSNYDDTEARTVGGLNGYGAKLTNAFSTKFVVDICDGKFNFIQTWENNMSVVGKPKITASKKKPYTRISFIPDYTRFNCVMDQDLSDLLKTRVYEGSAITDKRVCVYFNGDRIPVKTFQDYIKMFLKERETFVYEKMNDRWEFAVCLNPYDKFTQVSFVNGISTSEGGTHVDMITNQIIYKLKEQLEKKHKDINIRPTYIKDNLLIFVNCLIENPVFSSQTKENHVTKINKFGSKCELSDEIIKKIEKLGITANVVDIAKAKENKSLSKTDGTKKIRLTGIPKLDDANKAGGSEGYKCKLILTEGDSAKASAIAGLSVVGRDYYGVFPLRGKLLNVRDATAAQLLKNEEINCLKKIMGLQQGKEYNDLKSLRYGGIIIFTDADNDGSHIKGLIINWVHSFWPSLLKIDTFISSIVTPIVKVTKGPTVKAFYNQTDFNTWKESINTVGWQIKYYKGLGTSTAKEAKEYFTNLAKQTVVYNYTDTSDDDLVKAFKKGFEDQRKEWIKESTGKNYNMDHTVLKQSISQFVNQELINFSIADLERSIPNMMDGFKPSQRKVLYACLKKGLYSDMKVAQLSGYISEHTSYHHGEVSLQGTIINMAQDYVGSNNMNLLVPSGQFGTRITGGKDSASPRYIFTHLQGVAKTLFNEHDNILLDYLDDDGMKIEPKYYIPIIPMILVNGSEGIGTGYSTNIPCYNPTDIIANLKKLIESDGEAELVPMIPWYRGFTGTIVLEETGRYITTGVWKRVLNSIEISELPIGKWTQNYKEFLESLVESNEILDYRNGSDDRKVFFKVMFQKTVLDELETKNEIVKKLKLTTFINTTNMHVFDEKCTIRKVHSPEEIIDRFYRVRRNHFIKRKKYLIDKLSTDYKLLEAKIRFIKLVIEEKIILFNKKKDFIVKQLLAVEPPLLKVNDTWDYLLEMKIHVLTEEKIKDLETKMRTMKSELETLKSTSIKQMWSSEINLI
uniref:DNA topoisomerase (ATP-hydrolyzing) n=1 Tax=viral metagenome TaxID=1070528 RepID=A0A6C0B025_9ZZZZ